MEESYDDSSRKIVIHNVKYTTTEANLKSYFERFGVVKRVFIGKDRQNNHSKGFAFVKFATPADVDAVQHNRPHVIDGFIVHSKRYIPGQRGDVNFKTMTTICVGNVDPLHHNKDNIVNYFQQFGEIVQFELEAKTNVELTRAFVKFSDYDSVDQVILKTNHIINGMRVTVVKVRSDRAWFANQRGGFHYSFARPGGSTSGNQRGFYLQRGGHMQGQFFRGPIQFWPSSYHPYNFSLL